MEITVFSTAGKIIFSHNREKSSSQNFHDENLIRFLSESMPRMNNMMPGRGKMYPGRISPPEAFGNNEMQGPPHPAGPEIFRNNNMQPPPPGYAEGREDNYISIPDNRNIQGIRQFMKNRLDEAFKGQVIIRPVITDRQIKAFVKSKITQI